VVTRALCHVANGVLTDLVEVRGLHRDDTGRITAADGSHHDAVVPASMNFWLLPPSVLPALQHSFEDFLRVHGHDPISELPLPDAVGELVRQQALRVHVLETPGPWVGITHPQDRADTAAMIRTLVDNGTYPRSLWSRSIIP
jgi:hypothetical protein